MTPIQQLMLGLGSKNKVFLDEVFSTYLYTGTGSARSINNAIDLASEGGMVWSKVRNNGYSHALVDSARGVSKVIRTERSNGELTASDMVTAFNSNGYSLGNDANGYANYSGTNNYVSYTFRKSPMFQVTTWNGNSSARLIAHGLNSIPGMILVKRTDSSDPWQVYHRGLDNENPENYRINLNELDQRASANINYWNETKPTSTHFSLGTSDSVNGNGGSYVGYIFSGGESEANTARSIKLDGNSDYLSLASTSDVAFGTGDFTVEAWVKTTDYTNAQYLLSLGDGDDFSCGIVNNNWFYYNHSTGTKNGGIPTANQWTHFAVARSSGTSKLFINGIEKNSWSDSRNFSSSAIAIGRHNSSASYYWDGDISNLRIVKGTAVYTSSFRRPTEPLTSIANTVLLCCNNSSTTGKTTGGTITANGSPTAIKNCPFEDTAAHVFGESGSESVIATGSYIGNGSVTAGPEIFLGFEPSFLLVKRTDSSGNWELYDSMRGITTDVSNGDKIISPNLTSTESDSSYRANLTPTGFVINDDNAVVNDNGGSYIFLAIRRSDGYVGKPKTASELFAMDTGSSSSTIPNFDSGFPVDWALARKPTISQNWFTGARLIQGKYLNTNTTSAESGSSGYSFDSNSGWNSGGLDSSYQSWMWSRGQSFDLVAYKGTQTVRAIRHSMNTPVEFILIKNRSDTMPWYAYHVGLNGGSNPEQKYIRMAGANQAEITSSTYWNNTAPTSVAFTLGTAASVNDVGHNFIAMLFSSVDKISKCGYYTGNGTVGHEITGFGFQPRFIIVKSSSTTTDWVTFDTLRGWSSGNDKLLKLNSDQAQIDYQYGAPTSDGFTIAITGNALNGNGEKYIYYAHA